jgi:DNA-binding protein HU-beta
MGAIAINRRRSKETFQGLNGFVPNPTVYPESVCKTEGEIMNKSDLIEAMADAADISKSAAGRALDGLTDAIAVALKRGESVSVIGFGTFSIKKREARKGRNPQTGQEIDIAASKTPSFKAGKALKDAVK